MLGGVADGAVGKNAVPDLVAVKRPTVGGWNHRKPLPQGLSGPGRHRSGRPQTERLSTAGPRRLTLARVSSKI